MERTAQSRMEGAPRRTSMLDVRRGVRPVHSGGMDWVVVFSVTPMALALAAADLTSFHPIREVSASV